MMKRAVKRDVLHSRLLFLYHVAAVRQSVTEAFVMRFEVRDVAEHEVIMEDLANATDAQRAAARVFDFAERYGM